MGCEEESHLEQCKRTSGTPSLFRRRSPWQCLQMAPGLSAVISLVALDTGPGINFTLSDGIDLGAWTCGFSCKTATSLSSLELSVALEMGSSSELSSLEESDDELSELLPSDLALLEARAALRAA